MRPLRRPSLLVLCALAPLTLPARIGHAHGPDDEPLGPAGPGTSTTASEVEEGDDDADAPKVDWDIRAPHGPGQEVRFTTHEGTWMGVDISPDGTTLLFDLLGDLYTLPIAGGTATALTRGTAWDTDAHWSADGKRIAYASDAEGNEELWVMNADGTGAERITREDTDRYTDPVWAPEDGWMLGRRRSTDTRSIGVQELWLLHERGGKGVRLTMLDTDPHVGEAAFSPDGRYVWYSTRNKRFEYNESPYAGMWQIVRFDRELAERRVWTDLPQSASRPTPSPDGRTLAFLTRDRATTWLSLLDLASGRVRRITNTLDPDQMESFELRGTYPRMDWTPDGKALVYWAKGGFWRVDASTGVSTAIPLTAEVTTRITDAVRPQRRLADGPVHARVIRWPTLSANGTVYAAALGRIWAVPPTGVGQPLTPEATTAYFPGVSPDGTQLAWVSWDDTLGGQVWVQPVGAPPRSGGTPKIATGRRITSTGADYQSPAISPDGKEILFLRGSGTTARGGDLGGEARYDLMIAPLESSKGRSPSGPGAIGDGSSIRAIPFRGSNAPAPRPQWSADGRRIYWLEDEAPAGRVAETAVLVSCKRDGTDKRVHVRFPEGAQEVRLSPDGRWLVLRAGYQAWLAPLPALGTTTLAFPDLPSRKLTDIAGDWVDFTTTGGQPQVTWSHGDQLYSIPIDGALVRDAKEIPTATGRPLVIEVPALVGEGGIAFTNARILPVDAPPIPKGTLVVDGRRIVAVGADVAIPSGVKVIDVAGRTILPGIVDVHAHLHYASGDVFPEQEWRHLVNLAYGVTTVFDPSAASDLVFGQGELVAAGRMVGPRVLSTGYILYGALDNLALHQKAPEDAERAVQRLKELGAWGVKSYQQSHRSHRQWIVEACRKLGLLDVPEGGGDMAQNLNMILDGHSSIEHSLPVAPLYDDVVQLWAHARTAYTPTLLVAYGGLFGEVEQYQEEDVFEETLLTRFTPPDVLVARAYRLSPSITDDAEWRHHLVEASAAKLRNAGVLVTLGAHGQLQGLGPHWEMEMLGAPGAMTPAQAIEAATLSGARHLGLDADIGSLTPGKIADLAIVDGDPLANLKDARSVVWVMKDGVLYDAHTMDRLSPDPLPREQLIWEAAQSSPPALRQ